jgi:hypothetical protein
VRLGEKDEMGSVAQKDNDFQRKLQLGPLAPTFVAQIESDCKVRWPARIRLRRARPPRI